MKARIFKPTKNTMQSGRGGNAAVWMLEYELETPRRPDALMGWTSAGDTLNQVRMRFASKEAAIAFAENEGMEFTVIDDQPRKVTARSYLDNFKFHPPEEDSAA